VQFAARQRRLEQVGRIHRAIGLARADQGVHLVDEQDDLAFGALHFVEHGLQAFLELAAILRAGDQAAHVERHQAAMLEAVGHVAIGDAQRQAFGDRRLAHAGFADQRRVVLGAAREDLHGAADFLVAADHRIELAGPRRLGQVARVLLHRVIGVFRPGAVGSAAATQRGDRRFQRLGRKSGSLERLAGSGGARQRQGQQHPLHGHEAVAALGRDLLGLVEQAHGIVVQPRRSLRARAGDCGQLAQRLVHVRQRHGRVAAGALDQPAGHAFLVFQQGLEHVFGGDALVAQADGQGLGRLEETLGAIGEFLEVHDGVSLS
jgi:hypothetical protein